MVTRAWGDVWVRQLDGALAARHDPLMLIYKILRPSEWAAFRQTARTEGAPVDLSDGFIHFSTAEQAPATAAKHFSGEDDLTLLAVDANSLGDALKWEVSRGGARFPHLYRALDLADVEWARPLPLRNGAHAFPEDMA